MRLILILIFAIASGAAMAAGSSVGYGNGGQFSRFDPVVNQYNQSGELFRIEGHCQSSCTLFLSIKNVCIERTAFGDKPSAERLQRKSSQLSRVEAGHGDACLSHDIGTRPDPKIRLPRMPEEVR